MNSPVPSFQKGQSNKRRGYRQTGSTRSGYKRRGPYEQPRQVEHHWNFYKKGIYVAKPGTGLPGWFLPLLALVLIVVLIFWGVPVAITRLQNRQQRPVDGQDPENELIYTEQTLVVSSPVADIFDRPDVKAVRVTQALFNEPVMIRSDMQDGSGFVEVELIDGTTGFIMSRDVTERRTSIEPGLYRYKLVIATAAKRIMSHAVQGTLLVEVMMGTVLYADYRGDGISRVGLPDGTTGWISDEGVIVLPVDGSIETPNDAARYFCSTALTFRQVTVIENGQSIRGISTTGIARLAAAINGLSVPRTLVGLSQTGKSIAIPRNPETGLIDLSLLHPGDLLFLADDSVLADDLAAPATLAIYVDTNQILFARPVHSAIQLLDLSRQEDLQRRIVLIRRLFE